MDVAVPGVVPNALGLEFERVEVCGRDIVCMRVRPTVATAADVSADKTDPDKTDPEVRRAPAVGAVRALGGGGSCREGKWTCGSCRVRRGGVLREKGLRVPTDGTPTGLRT